MRSLTVKLVLAFLIVSLTGAVLSALFIQQRTNTEFNRFLSNQYQRDLVTALTEFYISNGSWNGVDQVMDQMERLRRIQDDTQKMSSNPRPPESRPLPLMLVDANRIIVFTGSELPPGGLATKDEISQGLPLEVDGKLVGWLTISPRLSPGDIGGPERNFLSAINQVLLISAVLASIIALVLGVALARTLTRPIRDLTHATQAIAAGELGTQVLIRSKDELGGLADSFNKMSTDLAKATQARRQMTADIAHDLRSPLTVILGYTEALSDAKLEGTPEIFEIMHKEAGLLNRLIEDLRTLSLADAGELVLFPQMISPGVILERSASAYRPLCEQKGINLELRIEPNLPEVFVDPERMNQVLGNLMTNALRYTPANGNIVLGASGSPHDVELQVQDDGIGIPVEEQPFVFDRFYRADRARTYNNETGLGLAIAKSIVEAHSGAIRLQSEPGKGALFTISIPKQ